MAKKDLQQKLTELGIKFDENASVKELKALLANAKSGAEGSATGGEETKPEAPEKPEPKPKAGEARVVCPNPAESRTYSLEAHGEDYANLANQYAGKKGCQVQ